MEHLGNGSTGKLLLSQPEGGEKMIRFRMLDVQPPYAFLIDLDAAETLDEDQRTEQHLQQLQELVSEVVRLNDSMKAAGQINLTEVKGQLLASRLRLASHELSFMMILCDSVLSIQQDNEVVVD